MSFNLFDSVKESLGNDVINNASYALGENERNMHKAVSGAIPSVLTGLLDKAGSGESGSLLRMSKETYNSGMLSNIGRFFTDHNLLNKGTDLVEGIFGSRMNNVSNMISDYAGIRPSSATALMSAAAPAALGALGRHASSTNMNSENFLSFLNGQKDSILNSVPSGLNLAGALGLTSLGSIGSKLTSALSSVRQTVRNVPAGVERERTNRPAGRWLVPALLALAIVALLWSLLGRRTARNANMRSRARVEVHRDTGRAATGRIATPPPRPATQESIRVQLPNGQELNAYRGGIEDRLVAFLKDPSQRVDNNTWFDFDNVNFETGSAQIMAESRPQLQNIASIMKAFPNAAIKIGGYTDKTGDEAANMKLSQERAEAIESALKEEGVPASQIAGAEGFGSQYAKVAADASDEERKVDRRMAVSVRRK